MADALICCDCPLWYDDFDSSRDEAVCLALSEEANAGVVFAGALLTDAVRTARGHECTAQPETLRELAETLLDEAGRR